MKIFKLCFFIVWLSCLFSCQKEYSLEAKLNAAGTWQFNDDTKLFKGNIDSAYIEVAGATRTLSLIGRSDNSQENFLLHLYATDSFTVGTYKASLFQTDFQYFSTSKNIYQADQFIGEFIVTITAIGNNSITGIFSGDSEDSTGTIKPITLGMFTSRINLTGNGTGGGVTPPLSGDYFPTTTGSFWVYENTTIADSFLITATSRTKSVGSITYKVFSGDDIPASGSPYELYYRKSGGEYFQYLNAEEFFGLEPGTATPPNMEYIFLKDNVAQGNSWQSQTISGKAPINNVSTAVTVYIKMTLIGKSVTATVGGASFNDVMKVKYEYFGTIPPLPAIIIFTEERWFAKNVGLIYNSFSDGTTTEVISLKRYKVF